MNFIIDCCVYFKFFEQNNIFIVFCLNMNCDNIGSEMKWNDKIYIIDTIYWLGLGAE